MATLEPISQALLSEISGVLKDTCIRAPLSLPHLTEKPRPKARSEKITNEDGRYGKAFSCICVRAAELHGVFRDVRVCRRVHRQSVCSQVDGLYGPNVVLASSGH